MTTKWYIFQFYFFPAIYLLYAKLEEEHGLARHAMNIYDRATRGVEKQEQNEVSVTYLQM